MTTIGDPLDLPCGLMLPNRVAKAAMTEGLADPHGRPDHRLERLYRRWSEDGTGLLITGNVQIDADHLERAGNVVLDREPDAAMQAALERWAEASKSGGARIVMQLSHAGRQTMRPINPTPNAPSAVPMKKLPFFDFGQPRAMDADEIEAVAERFVVAARAAAEAGFDGVQVHAAHGYLLSSFLSPLTNRREDGFGGSLENRASLLLDVVRRVRAATDHGFALSVKLNSADFQRGGFDAEDSERVARWLDEAGVDLIEISGGNYEQAAMMGDDGSEQSAARRRTAEREAYFLDSAPRIAAALSRAKLMVTGGFRSRAGMDAALADGAVDVIGIARPLIADPEASRALLDGGETMARVEDELRLGPGPFGPRSRFAALKALNAVTTQAWYYEQLERLGNGEEVDPRRRLVPAAAAYMKRDKAKLAAFREARASS